MPIKGEKMSNTLIGKSVSKKHVKQIEEEMLTDNEQLQAIIIGRVKEESTKSKGRFAINDIESDKGGSFLRNYMIVTDQRVSLWARGLFNKSHDSFFYNDIKSVEFQKGIMYGSIVLNIHGKTENFSEASKKECDHVAKLIKENIQKATSSINAQSSTVVNQTSSADELKKFKELLDSGVINQEEFNSKKKELLGI